MKRAAVLVSAGPLVAGCGMTLPGHQAGPPPHASQYTCPGYRGAVPRPATDSDGDGPFVFSMVFTDGSAATSISRFDAFERCEQERREYQAVADDRVKTGGAERVMTVRCHRAHETGVTQARQGQGASGQPLVDHTGLSA